MATSQSPLLHQRPLYLIRFTQTHLSFRPAEIAAKETLLNSPALHRFGSAVRLRRRRQRGVGTGAEAETGMETEIGIGVGGEGVREGSIEATRTPREKLDALWGDGKRVRVEVVRYEEGSPFCVVAFRVVRSLRRGDGRIELKDGGRGGGGGGVDQRDGAGEADVSVRAVSAGRATGQVTTRGPREAGANVCDNEGGVVKDSNGHGVILQNDEAGTIEAPLRGDDEEDEVECEEDNHDEELLAEIARRYISRSVQAKGIYEIWGHAAGDGRGLDGRASAFIDARSGAPAHSDYPQTAASTSTPTTTNAATPPLYDNLHASTRALSSHRWTPYQTSSTLKFKLSVDSFNHARSALEQRDIINSFAYLDFSGLVRMKDFNQEWVVFEEWLGPSQLHGDANGCTAGAEDAPNEGQLVYENTYRRLSQLWFTRAISTNTLRPLIEKHDLKKRPYISTTSMDAELALVTANLALAEPGKMFLDPFCGTGGFLIAAAELGAWVLGSDIDGRSFRGKGDKGLSGGVGKNVKKYGLQTNMGGCFTGDLVNSPLLVGGDVCGKASRWLDGIIADPPYGVREGLKVLGARKAPEEPEGAERKPHLIDGVPAHKLPGYIAPKKPYSFEKMLDDVLEFAWKTLVDGGRLAFWMPSANENERGEEEETAIPEHPGLTLLHVCVQRFNRWSRRLLVYERKAGTVDSAAIAGLVRSARELAINGGGRADDLNPFRKRYFQAFAVDSAAGDKPSV